MTAVIQTVLGDVNPAELGRTLTHEHLSMEFTHFYRKPPIALNDKFLATTFQLNNIGYVRQYPYSSRYNLILNDDNAHLAVLNDVVNFKKCGGGTIVENSTDGLERSIQFCKQVANSANINVVVGTGYYISDMQPDNNLHNTQENMYNHMKKELTEGCSSDSSVKAGFMGEIASVWPLKVSTARPPSMRVQTTTSKTNKIDTWFASPRGILRKDIDSPNAAMRVIDARALREGGRCSVHDFEIKAIKAAGEVQEEIKCGVSFHPHRVVDAPFEIIRLYLEAGGSSDKAVMSHLDRTLMENDKLLEFSELGTYCQFDLFGVEVSYYQLSVETDMPSDAQRLDKIRLLVNEKKADRILMSHDIHTKHRLTNFGGHGYSHIINNVLPKMKSKGFTEDIIDEITIDNPANWLAIHK